METYDVLAYFIMLPHIIITVAAFAVVFILGYNNSNVFNNLLYRFVPVCFISSVMLLSESVLYFVLRFRY